MRTTSNLSVLDLSRLPRRKTWLKTAWTYAAEAFGALALLGFGYLLTLIVFAIGAGVHQ